MLDAFHIPLSLYLRPRPNYVHRLGYATVHYNDWASPRQEFRRLFLAAWYNIYFIYLLWNRTTYR